MKVTIEKPVTDKIYQPKFDEITKILENQHKLDLVQTEWNMEIATAIIQLDQERIDSIIKIENQITKIFAIYAGVLAVVAMILSIAIYIK